MANEPVQAIGGKLSYGTTSSPTTRLWSIIAFPELGGTPEAIDITTLADSARVNIPGVKSNEAMEFTGIKGRYGAPGTAKASLVDEYATLRQLVGTTAYYWEIEWPDGSKDSWQGYPSCRSSGQEVNGAPSYLLSILPATELAFTAAPSGT